MKNLFYLAFTLLISSAPALALEFFEGEGPPKQVPPIVIPEIAPPPPAPPPPPPAPSSVVNLVLPTYLPNTTILPTDVVSNLIKPSVNVQGEPIIGGHISPDERYQFDSWVAFAGNGQQTASKLQPIAYTQMVSSLRHTATSLRNRATSLRNKATSFRNTASSLRHTASDNGAYFKPTRQADFTIAGSDHLLLRSGALLVKTGQKSVTIETMVNDEPVSSQIKGGAIAMISTFDGKTTILHLTDDRTDALVSELPTGRSELKSLGLSAGQIALIYNASETADSTVFAGKPTINERLSDNRALMVSQCNYVNAIKRFNLKLALGADYPRVLKTAAALAYVRRPVSI